MKKILFIIPTLQGGGAEKLLVDILKDFDYDQYEVHLMYFYEKNIYLSQVPPNVRKIVPFYIKPGLLSSLKRCILKMLHLEDLYYRRLILKSVDGHYDTVISFLHGLALHFHQYFKDRADKHISFVHFDFSKSEISYIKRAKQEYALMDTIAFVSKNAQDAFEKIFTSNKSTHVLLPNFIDIQNVLRKSKEFPVVKQVPTFICVGRLEKEKGFDILIDVALLIRKRYDKFLFRVLGTGSEEKRLKELIGVNDLHDYFEFLGFQVNPYPYMANADIMLSTSLEEGFGLVICEAMALGIPVISSKTAGAQSLLNNGGGVLVNRVPEEYYNAINALLVNHEKYSQYVRLARNKSREHDRNIYMPNFYKIL